MKEFLEIIFVVGVPLVTFIVGYSKLVSKFESHEKEDEKEFQTLMKYSTEFFDRVTKLEISQSAQSEINKNHGRQYDEIKSELGDIKSILLKLIKN